MRFKPFEFEGAYDSTYEKNSIFSEVVKCCMKTKNTLLLVLVFVFCLWLPATGLAAEKTYRITEQELNQLESNLTQLQQLNEKSQKELSLLKIKLQESRSELNAAKEESGKLRSELMELRKTSMTQEQLLQSANESLKMYAEGEKKRLTAIKKQRNIAYGVGAVLLYALVRK